MSGAAPGDQIAEMKPHFHCTRMRLEPHATPPRRTRAHVPSTCARRSVGDGASWDDRRLEKSQEFLLPQLRGCRDGHTNARFVRVPTERRCRPRHPRHPRHSRHPCHSRHLVSFVPLSAENQFYFAGIVRSKSVRALDDGEKCNNSNPNPNQNPNPDPNPDTDQTKKQVGPSQDEYFTLAIGGMATAKKTGFTRWPGRAAIPCPRRLLASGGPRCFQPQLSFFFRFSTTPRALCFLEAPSKKLNPATPARA